MNVATNIRIPEEMHTALKHKAVEERKSLNKLIFEAIEASLKPQAVSLTAGEDSFDVVIGTAHSGCKDGSAHHDRFLYGKKR